MDPSAELQNLKDKMKDAYSVYKVQPSNVEFKTNLVKAATKVPNIITMTNWSKKFYWKSIASFWLIYIRVFLLQFCDRLSKGEMQAMAAATMEMEKVVSITEKYFQVFPDFKKTT